MSDMLCSGILCLDVLCSDVFLDCVCVGHFVFWIV